MQRTRTRNGCFAFTLMRKICLKCEFYLRLSKVGSGGGALRHTYFRYASWRGVFLYNKKGRPSATLN